MKTLLLSFVLLSLNTLAEFRSCKQIDKFKGFADVNRCEDGSVSFEQPSEPSSKGKKSNWNGQCGAVAAANVYHAYCGRVYPVADIYKNYFTEWINTPGIRPSTLTVGLNEAFGNESDCISGEWRYHNTDNQYDFIKIIKKHVTKTTLRLDYADNINKIKNEIKNYPDLEMKKYLTYYNELQTPQTVRTNWNITVNGKKQLSSPAIVLLSRDGGDTLHYVTVVNVQGEMILQNFSWQETEDHEEQEESCYVTYNEWGDQKVEECREFASWASQADDGIGGAILFRYNYILFR